jgi:hypothetical protein
VHKFGDGEGSLEKHRVESSVDRVTSYRSLLGTVFMGGLQEVLSLMWSSSADFG